VINKIYLDFYIDEDGLNTTAIAFSVSAVTLMILGIRLLVIDHNFDSLSYGLSFAVILLTYGGALGDRARSNSRFRKLEERLANLEESYLKITRK